MCFNCVFACVFRVARDLEDRRSQYEPSVGAMPDDGDHAFKLDEHDFVPHYQRVSISGEDTSGVSITAVALTISCLISDARPFNVTCHYSERHCHQETLLAVCPHFRLGGIATYGAVPWNALFASHKKFAMLS